MVRYFDYSIKEGMNNGNSFVSIIVKVLITDPRLLITYISMLITWG
jgi:hypothetical protein